MKWLLTNQYSASPLSVPELSARVGRLNFWRRGFDVIATDPAPNAEANLRKYIDTRVAEPDGSGSR